jgi:hypothetical protein
MVLCVGPVCGRKVQPKGGHYLSPNFVDLYPVRFKLFLCDSAKPYPTVDPDKTIYFPSSFSMTTLNEEMKTTFNLRAFQTRCWLEIKPSIENDSNSNLNGKEGVNGSEESNADVDVDDSNNKCMEPDPVSLGPITATATASTSSQGKKKKEGEEFSRYRYLTSDVTDLMGSNWRLLRYVLYVPCYVPLCYIMSCYVMSCHVMLCYIMSCHVMLYNVMSCYDMSCYVMLYYVMSCHVMSCHVMLCYVMLCYFVLCYIV